MIFHWLVVLVKIFHIFHCFRNVSSCENYLHMFCLAIGYILMVNFKKGLYFHLNSSIICPKGVSISCFTGLRMPRTYRSVFRYKIIQTAICFSLSCFVFFTSSRLYHTPFTQKGYVPTGYITQLSFY